MFGVQDFSLEVLFRDEYGNLKKKAEPLSFAPRKWLEVLNKQIQIIKDNGCGIAEFDENGEILYRWVPPHKIEAVFIVKA